MLMYTQVLETNIRCHRQRDTASVYGWSALASVDREGVGKHRAVECCRLEYIDE